ncbi:MAG: ABC transporter permease subunit [Verrucomicrobiota bacterium]
MTFLPIVERELRVAARRPAIRRTRLLAAWIGFGFCFAGFVFTGSGSGPFAQSGALMFRLLSTLAFFFCLFSGVLFTSDCLSQEKREGTLGLLFLTDLRGYDIILGKLAASSLGACYGLLAVLPVLLVPFLCGGVSGGELLRVILALVNTMAFSLAAGMAVSALTPNAEKSAGWTIALLLAVTLGNSVMSMALAQSGSASWPAVFAASLGVFNLWGLFQAGFEPAYGASGFYWASLAWTCASAAGMLLAAGMVVQRTWNGPELFRRQRDAPREPASGVPQTGGSRIDGSPIQWFVSRNNHDGRTVWLLFAVSAAIALPLANFSVEVFPLLGFVIWPIILQVMVARTASRFFVRARESGELELLFSTPLSNTDLVRGQWLAIKRTYSAPGTVTLTVTAGTLIWTLFQIEARPDVTLSVYFELYEILRITMDFFAAAWMGMWLGLSHRRPAWAWRLSVLYTVVIPWGFFFLPGIFLAMPMLAHASASVTTRMEYLRPGVNWEAPHGSKEEFIPAGPRHEG